MKHITEKDLYYFVFSPTKLAKDTYTYIKMNYNKFKDELELLTNLQENLEKPVSDNIIDEIHNKINKYSANEEFTLEKIEKINADDFKYAAVSISHVQEKFLSFSDTNKNYLAKVLNDSDEIKIYIFAKDLKENCNFNITLLPSNESYSISLEHQPLIIPQKQNVAKIILTVTNL